MHFAAAALNAHRAAGAVAALRPLRRSSTLTIVSVNDVYELGNLARLRTLIDRVRPHITTLCGDFVSPSTLSGLDRGRGMVSVLNRVGARPRGDESGGPILDARRGRR